MKTGKVLAAFAAVVALIMTCGYLMAVNVRVVTVKEVSGSVTIQRAGSQERAAATVGMRLYQGDTIKTGSRSKIVLELDDGSLVQLTSLTTMTVDRLSKSLAGKKTAVEMDLGKSWMKVKKLSKGQDKFNVGTPSAVAGVRGTYFSTEVEQTSDSTFDVFEGQVDVSQRTDPTQIVEVKSNHRTQVKAGGKNPSSPSSIPTEDLQKSLQDGISGAMDAEDASYDLKIGKPNSISPGEQAPVTIQFLENGKAYNGSVTFVVTVGGSAKFVENNSQSIEVVSDQKGFAQVMVTDDVKEEMTIGVDVQFAAEQ